MTAEERLIELGNYLRLGGSSSPYAGAQLFERMLEGGGGGSGGMGKFPGTGSVFVLARIAETVRAVSALTEVEQATVLTCYIENLPHRAQQAAALGIKAAALGTRLHQIRLKIDAWLVAKGARQAEKFFREPVKIIS